MLCAYCTQEITDANEHIICRDAGWRQVCENFTRVKLAFMKQNDPGASKGDTVEVHNDPV